MRRLATDAAIDATFYTTIDDRLHRLAGNGPETLEEASEWLHHGQMQFPVMLRGRLRSVLICAFGRGDSGFDPDERRALEALVRHVVLVRTDLLNDPKWRSS